MPLVAASPDVVVADDDDEAEVLEGLERVSAPLGVDIH
jgi:hypothetical protein